MKRDVYLTIDLDYWFSAKTTGSGRCRSFYGPNIWPARS